MLRMERLFYLRLLEILKSLLNSHKILKTIFTFLRKLHWYKTMGNIKFWPLSRLIYMATIKLIKAIQIFDSESNPTIKTTVILDNGIAASSSVPSNEVKNPDEALELRDGDPNKYRGLGVSKAIDAINNTISQSLSGLDVSNQSSIDNALIKLDGTSNKAKLGANSTLSVSQAAAIAAAKTLNLSPAAYLKQLTNSPNVKIP